MNFEQQIFQFIQKNKITEQYDWLVLPCGLESSYYIFLIQAIKPKNVYFLGTAEFKNTFLNTIIERTSLKPSQYIMDELPYAAMDISDVYEKVRKQLSLFVNKKVLMDLTRGKRIMSVGAGIVGSFFGFDLVYIDEEWLDDIKRGLPGTETLVMVKNPFEVFGDLELKEARDFFNHNNHGAALSMYRRISQKIVDPRQVEIEAALAEGYLHWNSFNFKAALVKIEQTKNKLQQYRIPIAESLVGNCNALKLLSSENLASENCSQELRLHVIIDLYANALRKAESGLYEDAVSRMYRVLELVANYRLRAHGLSENGEQAKKHSKEYRAATRELYGFEKEIPLEIGLKDSLILLFILNDYLNEGYSLEDLRRIFGIIRARDMSIVAHGLQLAGEKVFDNMNTLATRFVKSICTHEGADFSKILKEHTFVKL